MSDLRVAQEIVIDFAAGATTSGVHRLARGNTGTFLVPTGSDAIAKTIQFVATTDTGLFADTALLATPKTLSAGANPFTDAELLAVGAANDVKFLLSAAVTPATRIVLLWKS